ncbi:hypothetical protein F5Y03DRAFT_403082 [Xylaria venustula]|nr:hypothetical protein F5Y03DRAFT_403082 [Xylaria venustula]
MTMAVSLKQFISCGGDRPILNVTSANEGWSILKPILWFSSSRPSRHRPSPLQLPHRVAITEDKEAPKDAAPCPSSSAFDLGLGGFSPSSRADGAPWWASYHQGKIAREFFAGSQVDGYDDIDLHSEAAVDELSDYSTDICEDNEAANSIDDDHEFFEDLDDLEAARPKSEKPQTIIPGNREGIWDQPNFAVASSGKYSDWIEEVADMEDSVSMPDGARFYQVDDSGELTS